MRSTSVASQEAEAEDSDIELLTMFSTNRVNICASSLDQSTSNISTYRIPLEVTR